MQDGQWWRVSTRLGGGGVGRGGGRFCRHDGSTQCRAMGRISARERLWRTVRTAVDACGGWAAPRSEEATGGQEGQGGRREEGHATFRSR